MNLINFTTRSLIPFPLYLQGVTYIFNTKYFWYIYVLQRNIIWLTNCLPQHKGVQTVWYFRLLYVDRRWKNPKKFVLSMYVNLVLPNRILTSWSWLYCSTKTQCPGLVVQQARSRYISTEFATWRKKPN